MRAAEANPAKESAPTTWSGGAVEKVRRTARSLCPDGDRSGLAGPRGTGAGRDDLSAPRVKRKGDVTFRGTNPISLTVAL